MTVETIQLGFASEPVCLLGGLSGAQWQTDHVSSPLRFPPTRSRSMTCSLYIINDM